MESFVYFFDFVFAAAVELAAGLMVHQAVMYDMIMMDCKHTVKHTNLPSSSIYLLLACIQLLRDNINF